MSVESLVAERVAARVIELLDIDELAKQTTDLVSADLPKAISGKIIAYVRDDLDVAEMVYDAFSDGKASKLLGKAILRSVENVFEVKK